MYIYMYVSSGVMHTLFWKFSCIDHEWIQNADWHSLPLLLMTTTRTETTHWPISSMAGS